MQTLRKKNSPCKFKKEPTRFLGEGVSFKAKLIGILEVSEARGDRMCQAALADLKMAIRAAGEHKQRIAVQVSIDGLRLRDEKSGECLYHHPVHKISFIAQDMSDSRAFGYIFGSPDTGHRFFGIKTDKAANQVVIAMRDLFQVVFELKKKEIELAKQHIEQNAMKFHTSSIFVEPTPDTKGGAGSDSCLQRIRSSITESEKTIEKKPDNKSGVIADLLDLQFELHSLQQGIHQMDKLTPDNPRPSSEDPFESDPFGDSFINMKVKENIQPILPPPPTTAKRVPLDRQHTIPSTSTATSSPATVSNRNPSQSSIRWLENDMEKHFCDNEIENLTSVNLEDKENETTSSSTSRNQDKSPQVDVFTELDPLGTGLNKPYIDKKDFFSNLKNPPKKVLKDLVIINSNDTFPTNFDLSVDSFDPVKVNDKSINSFDDGNFADFDKFEPTSEVTKNVESSPSLRRKTKSIHHQPLSVCLPPEETSSAKANVNLEQEEPTQTSLYRQQQQQNSNKYKKKDYEVGNNGVQSMDKYFIMDFSTSHDSPASPHRSGSSEANSRLSSSSAELDIVPEPPPRGAGSIVINPPPLPPKKQANRSGNKPPPRPPHNDTHFQYDFIDRDRMISPVNKNERISKSPDRRQFDDNFIPTSSKAVDTTAGEQSKFEDSFNTMIPSNLSSFFKDSYESSSSNTKAKSPSTSLDITLSQLTSSNLNELAGNLNMSVSELTNLTLQQLTECLAKLTTKDLNKIPSDNLNKSDTQFVSDVQFKANFEENFKKQDNDNNTYDKYAVFRELLEMEKEKENINNNKDDNNDEQSNNFDRKGSSSIEDEIYENSSKIELNIKMDDDTVCDDDDNNKLNKNDMIKKISDEQEELSLDETINIQSSVKYDSNKNNFSDKDDEDEDDDDDDDEEDEEEDREKKHKSIESLNDNKINIEKLNDDLDKDKLEFKSTVTIAMKTSMTKNITKKIVESPSSKDRYAALREIVTEDEIMKKDSNDKIITENVSQTLIEVIDTSKSNQADHDLMKLFSAPQSQYSSPNKLINQNNNRDNNKTQNDIFEEIKMLNNSKKSNLTKLNSGFEDIFSPFNEPSPLPPPPPQPQPQDDDDNNKDNNNWAKFDTANVYQNTLTTVTATSNTTTTTTTTTSSSFNDYEQIQQHHHHHHHHHHQGSTSIGGSSPWSPDDKDFVKESPGFKLSTGVSGNRHSGESDNEWKDEEESEESNGRLKDEAYWNSRTSVRYDTNEDSNYYEDGSNVISDKDRHLRDRPNRKSRGPPWTKTGNNLRFKSNTSPWHEEARWEEDSHGKRYSTRKIMYKNEDERKTHWKCRNQSVRPPWNGDIEGFRNYEHAIYADDDRSKRRMMMWSEDDRDRDRDRFSSQESMGYDDEERWSRREYERRRWEEDGSRYWSRRGPPGPPPPPSLPPDNDYLYRKHNVHYYRDARERPMDYPSNWEEDYPVERGDNTHRYMMRKRNWPKRPNSANEDRNSDASYPELRIKYGVSKSECSDNDSEHYHCPYRSRSRESYWESDQEFDSWGERPYWSEGPESKSESLQRRKINRSKQQQQPVGRSPVIKPQSSPFEDDFSESIEHIPPAIDSLVPETKIMRQDISDMKQCISPRNNNNLTEFGRKDNIRKYKRSSYFDDDLTPTASVSSDKELKSTPDDLPIDINNSTVGVGSGADNGSNSGGAAGSGGVDSNRDSFFNGESAFNEDAFALKSEMADSVPETTTGFINKNSKQYGNNKSMKDHDIKKSESVNIFVRENDPFDDDDFFN